VGGLAGAAVVVLIGTAGAGVYFVAHHIHAERTTGSRALHAFDAVRATFPDQPPLYQVDPSDRLTLVRPLADLPTSAHRPQELRLLAWDPDKEQLVRMSLPWWMLPFARWKMQLGQRGVDLDLAQTRLDPDELERIGPALVFDYRGRDGARVLVWTQ
jgi:hypothetical protein